MSQHDVYRVTMVFSRGATHPNMTSSFYVDQPNASGFDIDDIGGCVKDWWNTELNSSGFTDGEKGLYDDTVSLIQVDLRKVVPLEPTIDEYTTGLPIAGTGASQTVPAENAVLVSLRTANIGRSYRGRLFLPPPAENAVDENLTLAVAENNSEQFVGLIHNLAAINGGLGAARVGVLSLYSKTENPTPPHLRATPIFTPVTLVKTDIYMRSQRRRNTRPASYGSEAV